MANRLFLGLAACAIPTALSWGAELQPITLDPSKPPAPKTASDRLVDSVIPAYGVRDSSPYRLSSRMNTLFRHVQLFTGHVDAMVLSNTLSIPDDLWEVPAGTQFPTAARPVLFKAELLPQQQLLMDMMAAVMQFEEETPLPNHYERWHINTAYRDLYRAGEHLALAIGDQRFGKLRDLHRAWTDYYNRLKQAQIVAIMASLVPVQPADSEKQLDPPDLEQLLVIALKKVTPIPWPTMSLDLEADPYPPVFLSAIPRWSEIDEEMRQRFINRFGVPGQPLTPFFPVVEEPEVPAEASEDTEVMEMETTVEVEASAETSTDEMTEPPAEVEVEVETEAEVEVEPAESSDEAEEEPQAMEELPAESEAEEPAAPVEELEIEMEDLELELE